MLIKMLKKLERKMDEHNEKFNRELEIIKNKVELKNMITEIKKNTLEGIHRLEGIHTLEGMPQRNGSTS